jgi:hypothetical protein
MNKSIIIFLKNKENERNQYGLNIVNRFYYFNEIHMQILKTLEKIDRFILIVINTHLLTF